MDTQTEFKSSLLLLFSIFGFYVGAVWPDLCLIPYFYEHFHSKPQTAKMILGKPLSPFCIRVAGQY